MVEADVPALLLPYARELGAAQASLLAAMQAHVPPEAPSEELRDRARTFVDVIRRGIHATRWNFADGVVMGAIGPMPDPRNGAAAHAFGWKIHVIVADAAGKVMAAADKIRRTGVIAADGELPPSGSLSSEFAFWDYLIANLESLIAPDHAQAAWWAAAAAVAPKPTEDLVIRDDGFFALLRSQGEIRDPSYLQARMSSWTREHPEVCLARQAVTPLEGVPDAVRRAIAAVGAVFATAPPDSEVLAVLDPATGDLLYCARGTQQSVPNVPVFPGAWEIHTHPARIDLSATDVVRAAACRLAGNVAISGDEIFLMQRDPSLVQSAAREIADYYRRCILETNFTVRESGPVPYPGRPTRLASAADVRAVGELRRGTTRALARSLGYRTWSVDVAHPGTPAGPTGPA